MPTIDQTVDFLIRNNAIALGDSPWPTNKQGEEVFAVDWERVFPPSRGDRGMDNGFPYGDRWQLEVTAEELGALEDALHSGPPKPGGGTQPAWDICAWYQPIHFFGHDWGIFIREDCVKKTALMIARFIPPHLVSTAPLHHWWKPLFRAALYLYFLHEHYHHKIECLGLRLHVVLRKSCYLPYNKLVYTATKGTDDQLEEALANADCYKRLGTNPYAYWLTANVVGATKRYLKWQFPHDPPGYRMAGNYLTNPTFDDGENALQAQVREATLTPVQPVSEWDLAPRMTQSFFPVTSNIWTVLPSGTRSRLPIAPIVPIRTCSTREMIRLLEQAGYALVDGGKGSHIKLEKAGVPRPMILPGNRSELSPGVAKTALRVLGDYNLHDLPNLVKRGIK